MKKVFITGAGGYIGRHLARQFKLGEFKVFGLGRSSWCSQSYSDWGVDFWSDQGFTERDLAEALEQTDLVIHCAGGSSVTQSVSNPSQDYDDTVGTTQKLLESMTKSKQTKRLVYISSAAVYGACENGPIPESAQLAPMSPYALNKLKAESLCLEHQKNFGVEVKIVRLFSVYGPALQKQLLWEACKRFVQESEPQFWGTGDETRDWIHIGDATQLIYAVSTIDSGYTEFQGGSGKGTSIRETLESLSRNFSPQPRILFNGLSRAGDPRYFQATGNRARELGWRPKIELNEGLNEYASWFKKYAATN